ncbi:hypothetical protein, partial [Piscirickettsia litoralis]|uniref:hypothetical protein n=1 Tax=Piscirickettsia litoralis TaxID=1891921 RepID=UPI0019112F7F
YFSDIKFRNNASRLIVKNNLSTTDSPCPGGNTVTIFYDGYQQKKILPGLQAAVNSGFSKAPGLGVQINNWYWTKNKMPISKESGKQNPDNSGAQIIIDQVKCKIISKTKAWYGLGIETYLVANVTATKDPATGQCELTISKNNYTNAVTPQCCAPPLNPSWSSCQDGQQGQTKTGQQWPPK